MKLKLFNQSTNRHGITLISAFVTVIMKGQRNFKCIQVFLEKINVHRMCIKLSTVKCG